MNILTLENITKSFTERLLFDQASFYLQEGEKVGILGINGTGKSTLLKIMAGLEEPDEGTVTKANNIVIRMLSQNPKFEDKDTVLESVLKDNVTKDNQWDIESNAKAMLMKVGVTDFAQPTGQLSGGQKKRLALISVLLSPADILILDEPTNHLDNTMADWLEDFLKNWRKTLIMVTHDRYFLDSVSNRIVEIDKGQIYSYQANYSGFLELKAQREDREMASERKRQSILRKEIEWMQRGARARSTKQKAHIQRYEDLKNQSGPEIDGKVELSSISTRMGRTTVEVENLCLSYGERKLIEDFSYIFLKGDRVGFIGNNGCGKSTLMKIIVGIIPQTSGTITIGQTVKIGYYAQEIKEGNEKKLEVMDPSKRVIDYIKDTAEYVQTVDGSVSASQMLEKFLFTPDQQYNLIEKLSGGEKRRLNLLRVLMEAPNVLILDEPTNDLDITTLTILEDYLDAFDGIVAVVSHDRYFLDRVVRRIFAFENNGQLVQYEGGYSDYAMKQVGEKESVSAAKIATEVKKSKETWGGAKKLKFTFQEQKDFDSIEETIATIEERLEAIDGEMLQCTSDFVKLNQLTKEKEEKEALLEEKMERWMYLEELYAKIQESNAKK
ncbi:MAG: ABC-F family ATP-binding cassette domain-containing protein [Eubacteriales bacterium]